MIELTPEILNTFESFIQPLYQRTLVNNELFIDYVLAVLEAYLDLDEDQTAQIIELIDYRFINNARNELKYDLSYFDNHIESLFPIDPVECRAVETDIVRILKGNYITKEETETPKEDEAPETPETEESYYTFDKVYMDTNKCHIGKITRNKNGETRNIHIYASILGLKKYYDPFFKETMFQYTFKKPNGETKTITAPNNDYLLNENKDFLLTAVPINQATISLNTILNYLEMNTETEIGISKAGIFYFNDELIFNKITIKDYIDTEKLKKALNIINTIISKYGYGFKEELALYYMSIMAMPFDYLARQLKEAKLMTFKEARPFWTPRAIFDGVGNTGKSFQAELPIILFDNLIDIELNRDIGNGAFNTEARIGDALSKSTFSVTIQEVEALFSNDKQHLRELVKQSCDKLHTRGYIEKGFDKHNRDTVQVPALSPYILTSNNTYTLDSGMNRRHIHIQFNVEYLNEVQRNLEDFKQEITSNLPILNELGNFILKTVRDEGIEFILKYDDGIDLGRELLRLAHEYVGIELPEIYNVEFNNRVDIEALNNVELEEIIQLLRSKLNIPNYYQINRYDIIRTTIINTFRQHRTNEDEIRLLKSDFKGLPSTISTELENIQRILQTKDDKLNIRMVRNGSTKAIVISINDMMELLEINTKETETNAEYYKHETVKQKTL